VIYLFFDSFIYSAYTKYLQSLLLDEILTHALKTVKLFTVGNYIP